MSGSCRLWVHPVFPRLPSGQHKGEDRNGASVSVEAHLQDPPIVEAHGRSVLMNVSNAMVGLHKEHFGRGPTRARSHFAGDDMIVCTLEGGLLPAEHALVEMGEQMRVQESRLFFQVATRQVFIETLEKIVGRKVVAFSSATDAQADVIWEIYNLDGRSGG